MSPEGDGRKGCRGAGCRGAEVQRCRGARCRAARCTVRCAGEGALRSQSQCSGCRRPAASAAAPSATCTVAPVHLCTRALLHPCTVAPTCTPAPPHPCTPAPLHPCPSFVFRASRCSRGAHAPSARDRAARPGCCATARPCGRGSGSRCSTACSARRQSSPWRDPRSRGSFTISVRPPLSSVICRSAAAFTRSSGPDE